MKCQRLAGDDVSGRVIDVIELRPRLDAIATDIRIRAERELRRCLPARFELETASITAIDVATERESDVGELAGRGDLVTKLHRVRVRRERQFDDVIIPSRF